MTAQNDATHSPVGGSARGHPRRFGIGIAVVAVTAYCAFVGFRQMFAGFHTSDDEGTMLFSLRAYLDGADLYGALYSRYGPFYFEFWGSLFQIAGVEPSHDAGRSLTLAAWLITSLLVGYSLARLTGFWSLGLMAQLVAFRHLFVLSSEPMHPGGLSSLLLATVVAILVTVLPKHPARALFVVGALASAISLVKVNVGVLLVAALVVAAAGTSWHGKRGALAAGAIKVSVIGLPLLLMVSLLSEPGFTRFALIATAALAATMLWTRTEARLRLDQLRWFVIGAALAAAIVLGLALVLGSEPGNLARGIGFNARRQLDAFAFTTPAVTSGLVAATAGLAASFLLRLLFSRAAPQPSDATMIVSALARLGAGAMMWFTLSVDLPFGSWTSGLGYQVALAWVALVPRFGGNDAPMQQLTRLAVCTIAILQVLHAFPVAGSQVQFGSFLLVVVGGLCLADGIMELRAFGVAERSTRRRSTATAVASFVVLGTLALTVAASARDHQRVTRVLYTNGVSFDLPGAESVRVAESQRDLYHQLLAEMDRYGCQTFLTIPGLHSLYLFTDTTPPVYLNSSNWTTVFDNERQQRALNRVRDIDDLCVIRNELLRRYWRERSTLEERGVLEQFIDDEFESVTHLGGLAGFDILVRRSASS